MGLCGSVFTTVYIGAFKPHGARALGPFAHRWPGMLCLKLKFDCTIVEGCAEVAQVNLRVRLDAVFTFLHFLAIGPALLGLVAMVFVNHVPEDEDAVALAAARHLPSTADPDAVPPGLSPLSKAERVDHCRSVTWVGSSTCRHCS